MIEPWVLYAGIAVWVGLGGYLAFLALRLKTVAARLSQLECLADEARDGNGSR